jgi:hypothetical protein
MFGSAVTRIDFDIIDSVKLILAKLILSGTKHTLRFYAINV